MIRDIFKSGVFYLFSTGLLTFYGIQVCPFLESLDPVELALVIGAAFLLGFAVRYVLVYRLDRMAAEHPGEVDLDRPWRILLIDLAIWISMGLLVTAWNSIWYDFPVGSGLKVVLGCLTLGIFTSTSLALDVEHGLIRCLAAEGDHGVTGFRGEKFLSITTKFLIFMALCIGVVAGVLVLLIFKDFQFIMERIPQPDSFQFGWIAQEILFVFAVLLLGTFVVVKKYSRNLRLMFDLQLAALRHVEGGHYDAVVPVVSHDEFSLIARQTNTMISGLREKERLKTIFGKYVSAPVAREILTREEGADLGGREVQVAVLFTDIRNFTPLTERSAPQEVIDILNQYFTLVVRAVHQQQGVLDKFIGDEIMAVFGLGNGTNPCQAALDTAIEIRRDLAGMHQGLAERQLPAIETGIGIHYGPVVAGNIGSQERLEYTVIGDTVNIAARLESLTKTIARPIALSEEVYTRVEEGGRTRLQYVGEFELKGKSNLFPVYSLAD